MKARPEASSSRAFTLLEIMIAVMIIAGLALVLSRFVTSTTNAIRLSTEASAERSEIAGLINLIQAQMQELPTSGPRSLVGQPHRFGEFSSDTLEWDSKAGIGLLTTAATGDYRVSLELKPINKGSSVLELGLRRRLNDSTLKEESWVPLLRPVCALEIRYYHAQLNSKVDRWNDANSLPTLIYLSVQRNKDEAPYEAVLNVPAANLQK